MSSFSPTLMGASELEQYMTSVVDCAKRAFEGGDYLASEEILKKE